MNDLMVLENEELKGIDESKALQIKAVFEPMVKMLEGFEAVYAEVMAKEISPEKCAEAKRLRLDIAKVRIEADKVRKEQKEEYLRAGNAIQGVYNILKFAVTDKEEKLKDVETYYEKIEAEKVAKLAEERKSELEKYEAVNDFVDLGKMPDDVWRNYLAGVKANYEAVKAAEAKAEADRIAKEKAEAEERERIRLENEQLKKEAEKREKARLAEQKKLEAERAKQEQALRAEREKAEAEKRIQDEIIRKEREAREKLEREAREKEAERVRLEKLEAEKKAAEARRLELAPDKEKLTIVLSQIELAGKGIKSEKALSVIRAAYKMIKDFTETLS